MRKNRYIVEIRGIVQGVGFRPFIYKLANSFGLKGFVTNTRESVVIEVDTPSDDLTFFLDALKTQLPAVARIDSVEVTASADDIDRVDFVDFEIIQSLESYGSAENITPDLAICPDCLREIEDPLDRRFQYPFNNCTQCGPRFTIIRSMPYDRKNTTMSDFEMCPQCLAEYNDINGRRYHAQPVSCFECGPTLVYKDVAGDNLLRARKALRAGEILAIKGLGGFHLACDALNAQSVGRLRQRKHRDSKPFAIMVKDAASAELFCEVSVPERQQLESSAAPIVLLKKRTDIKIHASVTGADGLIENPRLGIMLAYTPLHRLLFQDGIVALIMTSGNLSSEPVCFTDSDALEKLSGIADSFLTHNREIYFRNDDSVVTTFNNLPYIIRRSRGFVPVGLPGPVLKSVLAYGPDLKNTFAISKSGKIYLSHHIGDLENFDAIEGLELGVSHFEKIFDFTPEIIACDMHPGYHSAGIARLRAKTLGIECLEVQHHHAHMVSCMTENNIAAPGKNVFGLILDGTGYGPDGTIWGGELLYGGVSSFSRVGWIKPVLLFGGDLAVLQPWRNAVSWIAEVYPEGEALEKIESLVSKGVLPIEAKTIFRLLKDSANLILTSSAGRLFDSVSAILGIRSVNNHDAQAAMELEWCAAKALEASAERGFAAGFEGGSRNKLARIEIINNIFDPSKMIASLIEQQTKAGREELALEFHERFAEGMVELCKSFKEGLEEVVLSGGVFQNSLLLGLIKSQLENSGFKVYIHRNVPCNDGGIALGQCVIAGNL